MEIMKKLGKINFLLLISLFASILYISILYIENSSFKEKLKFTGEDYVSLRLKYNGYACGDCIPQYRVDSVISSENKPYSYYLNKDIELDFSKSQNEKIILPDCNTNCVNLLVEGNFEHNLYGMLRISVDKCNIRFDKNCCE